MLLNTVLKSFAQNKLNFLNSPNKNAEIPKFCTLAPGIYLIFGIAYNNIAANHFHE